MWTVIVSDQRGQVIAQHEWRQGSMSIGRDQGRSIVLPSKTASRKHARLDLVNGSPVIVDEGSANGTLVNGARIGAPMRVDDTSKIEIGEFRITLQRAEADDGERTVLMKPRAFTPAPPPPAAPPAMPTPAAPRPQAAPPRPQPAAPMMPAPAMPSIPARPSAGHASGDITSQFDRHLQSVRAYREEAQASTLSKKQNVDAEWQKMIQAMRALQTRLSADKRVLSFTISRDLKEVAVKIADSHEKRGHRYFLFSRDHPDGKYPGAETVWLREFGRDDASFGDPNKGMEELMLRIAGTLA
jgi:uncharacterized FlaG/YvyC family protein